MDYEPSDLHKYLTRWGFTDEAPAALQAHARECARLEHCDEDAVVVALGLATESQVSEALVSRPANVPVLEHLTRSLPSLREHSLRVSAISRGLAYFDTIPDQLIHAGAARAQALRTRLDELSAALLEGPSGVPILVFSELVGLLTFSQAGRRERAQDPLREGLDQEPVLALTAPAEIARASRHDAQSAPMHVVSSTAQDNFWSASLAKTDAERLLARLLDEAIRRKATDVQLEPQRDGRALVFIRIYGDLMTPERHAVLSPSETKEISNFLMSRSRANDGSRLREPADGQMTYSSSAAEAFIRTSFIPADRFGQDFDMVSVSLRLMRLTSRSISLKQLNLPDSAIKHIREALLRSQGLIVLAGPTNSGKSTTIAGVVGEHVEMYQRTRKRLSLEDPVERYLDGITQIAVENNFAKLMRALLRHDPDLVWVGEIRDAFSAAACVRASTSGHIVMSTVHANNSILAFRAISNYLRRDTGEATGAGASLFDLAESVSLLIGQRLVKHLCPHCRVAHKVTAQELNSVKGYLCAEGQGALVEKALTVLQGQVFKAGAGCERCDKTGYVGELPVVEILPCTHEVREIFARSETSLDVAELSRHRVNTLAEAALQLVAEGKTELGSLYI